LKNNILCPKCGNIVNLETYTEEVWGSPVVSEAYVNCECGYNYEYLQGNSSEGEVILEDDNLKAFTYIRTGEYLRLLKELKKNPYNFEKLKDEYQTIALCKKIVSLDGGLLGLVPEDRRTLEVCQIAVENEPFATTFIPKALKVAFPDIL